MNNIGLCECGCGETTNKVARSNKALGHIKGEHFRFIRHHHSRGTFLDKNPHWRGGEYINDAGYKMVYAPEHNRAGSNGYVREHILIAEKALGKGLADGQQVHHYGGTSDNSKLIICENQEYHHLLHMRAKAFNGSGDANKRKCKFCQGWDDVENLFHRKSGRNGWNTYHRECAKEYDRARAAAKRGGK